MTIPTFTPPPAYPSLGDRANFDTKADAYLAWWQISQAEHLAAFRYLSGLLQGNAPTIIFPDWRANYHYAYQDAVFGRDGIVYQLINQNGVLSATEPQNDLNNWMVREDYAHLTRQNTFSKRQTLAAYDDFSLVVPSALEPIVSDGSMNTSSTAIFELSKCSLMRVNNFSTNFDVDFLMLNVGGNQHAVTLPVDFAYTATLIVRNGATAYYCTGAGVRNVTVANVFWSGGAAPTKGTANGVDIYTFTVANEGGTINIYASVS